MLHRFMSHFQASSGTFSLTAMGNGTKLYLQEVLLTRNAGQRGISSVAFTRHADDILHGQRQMSASITAPNLPVYTNIRRVIVVDASVGHVIKTLPAQNVYELGFSPLGTFIITWQRPSKDDNGDAVKNLKVWRVIEGKGPEDEGEGDDEHNVVGRFVQKSQTGWNLQYTYDETYCARVVTNEVQFYESGNLSTVWNKLRVEGVSDFAVSPGKNHSIAVFIPERKVCTVVMHYIL